MLMEWVSRLSALILLVMLSPLFIIISIVSLFLQGSPIFFRQERVGNEYKLFQIYKYRTMINSNFGSVITVVGDIRITPWGRILRKFKLDELPQLWNVVKGDMRFVGPRPEIPQYVNENDFSFLEKLKPGLTDLSSILLRNESKILSKLGGNNHYTEILPAKIRLAHLYSNHKSFIVDLMLVCCTIIAIPLPWFASFLVQKLFLKRYDEELADVIQNFIR